ncbi:MAG: hypothetical protein OEY14_13200, partial [Myxococcales bacterium]|nr:hypothetical protein [Myxococcales bacterium]
DERPFLAHGHGLGAAYLPPSSLQGERAIRASVEALALDVGAYDQRGCLSPQFVFVARGAGLGARELASRLSSEGLSALEEALPRGELPLALEAAQMQWRGVAAAIGELFEGPRCATSFEPGLRPRLSPGHRHVSVLECEDLEEFLGVLRLFGGHLKALGVGGGVEERRRVAEALGPAQRPLISPLGQMQTPALDAETDGRSCWEGLFVRRR